MKYSIIIPTLNEEKLLPNLLDQLHQVKSKLEDDLEIIISDGGSTDNTLNIAKKYTDKIVYKKSADENIAIGRNKGAELATGDILIFFDADVQIGNPEKFFETIESTFKKNYLAMTCSVDILPGQKSFSDKLFMCFYNSYFHFLNLIGIGMGRGECQIIRKEVFDKLNGYNPNLAAGEDLELFSRIRKMGKIHFSRKTKVYESPRRYRKYGHFYIFLMWTLNGISVLLTKRSLSKEWKQIR